MKMRKTFGQYVKQQVFEYQDKNKIPKYTFWELCKVLLVVTAF